MPAYCMVPFCKSERGKSLGISFHEVPSNEKRRQQWLKIILQEDSETWSARNPGGYSVVCSKHFKPDDFRQNSKLRLLKNTACPSVFDICRRNMIQSKLKRMKESFEMGQSGMSKSSDSTEDKYYNNDIIVKCETEETFTCENEPFNYEEVQLTQKLKQEIES